MSDHQSRWVGDDRLIGPDVQAFMQEMANKVEKLERIVRDLAADSPRIHFAQGVRCAVCGSAWPNVGPEQHDPACTVARSVEWVKENPA